MSKEGPSPHKANPPPYQFHVSLRRIITRQVDLFVG